MLSPEYLRMITELTEQKVSEVNEYLTAKIINRIIELFEETGEVKLIPSSLLDLKKQQFAGRLLDEIRVELERQLPDIQKEIRRAFYDAGAKIADDVNATTGEILRTMQQNGNLTDVSMPKFESKQKASKLSDLNMTEKEISCLESAYRRTQGELYNLTKTSANSAQQTFIKACDAAYFKATHGTSLDTAIVEAIREVSEKGITTIHYASGYEDKIEVAIARAVRTGVNQANGDITLTRCAEAGVNYVITSSHIGARVTPYADYRTHADWQGQVYSLDWNRSELSQYEPQPHEVPKGRFSFLNDMKDFLQKQQNKRYKDFIDICGYGKMLGICGINCRHSFGLFYPGISINNQIQYDSEENKRRYQQEQKQRTMERGIRLIKRELNGLDSSGLDTEEAKMRKRELKEMLQVKDTEYKIYCQKNGLKPLNYRLQIAKINGVNNVGVVDKESGLKKTLHTLGVADGVVDSKEPIFIGEIDISKKHEAIAYFAEQIRYSEKECLYVIDREGKVYYNEGIKDAVSIGSLDLTNCSVLHNHPEANGILSFGKDDFELIRDFELVEWHLTNPKYNYFVRKIKDMRGLAYNSFYRKAMHYAILGDDLQHYVFEILKEEGFVEYVRTEIIDR